MAMLVNINPKVVHIEDTLANIYDSSYLDFLLHAVAYFSGLDPADTLQYHRSGDKEYSIIPIADGQNNQTQASLNLVAEVDDVLANLPTIIANQVEFDTPEAHLGLIESPEANTVPYGRPFLFNLLYNKTIPPSYTLDILITSPQGFPETWTVNIDTATEELEMLFTQHGTWQLELLGVKYNVEVQK